MDTTQPISDLLGFLLRSEEQMEIPSKQDSLMDRISFSRFKHDFNYMVSSTVLFPDDTFGWLSMDWFETDGPSWR